MADDSSSSNPLEQARSLSHVPWCSVYEDMICGRPFSTWLVPELEKRFMDVRRLCHAYSTAPIPADFSMQTLQQERAIQLQRMLGKVSSDTTIEPPFYCSYGCNIAISGRIYANINLQIFDSALVTIGERVLFGPNVSIITDSHETKGDVRTQSALPVTIGDDCWIGAGAIILPGVEIGNGTTVGAGAVVNRSIPSHSLAVGVPAVVKRSLEQSCLGAV